MKLTNREVQLVLMGLGALGQEKLPVKFAWKVNTIRDVFEPFHKRLVTALEALQHKYAEKDADGNLLPMRDGNGTAVPNTISIPPDRVEEADREFQELLSEEITIDRVVTLRLSEFPDSMELTLDVLKALAPIIED